MMPGVSRCGRTELCSSGVGHATLDGRQLINRFGATAVLWSGLDRILHNNHQRCLQQG